MSGDKSQDDKPKAFDIVMNDQIGLSDSFTVEASDITITAYHQDGEEQNIVFPQEVPSDVIARSVSDALCIPGDATAPFQELIAESVEHVKKGSWEGKMEIGLPLSKLHPWLPDLKLLSVQVKSGEKSTYKKTTIKTQLPKSHEAGE